MSDKQLPAEPHSPYEDAYTEKSFWDKVKHYARKAGTEVVDKSLQLHFAAQHPDTPTWAKSVIYGALGYFIVPTDAVPDITPMIGFTDDLGVLAAALATVAMHITPEIKQRSRSKVQQWFGDEDVPLDPEDAAPKDGADPESNA